MRFSIPFNSSTVTFPGTRTSRRPAAAQSVFTVASRFSRFSVRWLLSSSSIATIGRKDFGSDFASS